VDATARRLADVVRPLAADAVREQGAELVDVEFRREPGGWVLRLYIDKVGGVSLADCQRVSEVVGTLLEVQDPIPHAYTLEVSSPGLTRPLQTDEDWNRAVGSLVRIVARQPIEGRQVLMGRLDGFEGEALTVIVDGDRLRVARDQVARARLEVEWPSGGGAAPPSGPDRGKRRKH
jgi:ribosome maturation factor RimP